MNYLSTRQKNFFSLLKQKTHIDQTENETVEQEVKTICETVKKEKDAALIHYTRQFDHLMVDSIHELILEKKVLQEAYQTIKPQTRQVLKKAKARIESFHRQQVQQSWQIQDEHGNTLGQKVTPLSRVGLYVPGGKAAYPSSVLMNAIPAKVAGVPSIIMAVPTPRGEQNLTVLAAAYLCGIDEVVTIGGAQAVAAMAYGTETIQSVDKITGPGNAYVASAKKYVFGTVGIDMIAGPSEILIIADDSTPVDWVVLDLFSQAEHDEMAQSILISPKQNYLKQVEQAILRLLPNQPRAAIIEKSLKNRGLLIESKDLVEACHIANFIAAEHLELSVEHPEYLLEYIHHAGAIFMGKRSSESLGDYCAGPNHVLPTASSARFASPLGVYDFQKRTSLIDVSTSGSKYLGEIASYLAQEEGLYAHAESAKIRNQS